MLKIAIITCVTDNEKYIKMQESCFRAERGSSIDLHFFPVWGAPSMTSGYNEGLRMSQQFETDNRIHLESERWSFDYYVYIHQDVVVLDPDFFAKLASIFDDPTIRLIGFAGCKKLPNSLVFWEAKDLMGAVWEDRGGGRALLQFRDPSDQYETAHAADGLCLVTNVNPRDQKWNEDILGFNWYDISFCLDQNFGPHHRLVIPRQDGNPWLQHNNGPKEFDGNLYLQQRDRLRLLYSEKL
jgi:hypothetical protein